MILLNQVECHKCRDQPWSADRHDYRPCKCGSIAVDGGMGYLRRVGDVTAYTELSIEMPDEVAASLRFAIKSAVDTGRNDLGILCAVARTLRDEGVTLTYGEPK